MKVLLLSDPNSAHTIKWARSLAENGLSIDILGLSRYESSDYNGYENIQVYSLGLDKLLIGKPIGDISKLKYLAALHRIKKTISQINPEIVHAHFATSYGFFGALSNFHPFILSVWGADVYDFPRRSPLHRALLCFNLSRADKILSTSQVMAVETGRYTASPVTVTPFGIDLDTFRPGPASSLFDPQDIVIGTVKALEVKYGVDDLIRAFQILTDRYPHLPLKLLIVGDGSQAGALRQLAVDLGVAHLTTFTGRVGYDQVPLYHNMITVFVALSVLDSESFGVAVIEASACGKPVVVSNVGGLPEVVADGTTGLIVPPRSPGRAAEAIARLVADGQLRRQMGQAGREWVRSRYQWSDNVRQMLQIYQEMVPEVIRR